MTTAHADVIPGLDLAGIERVFAPFVVERFLCSDERCVEAIRRLERKYVGTPATAGKWVTADGYRASELVQRGYETHWGRVSLREELTEDKPVLFEWGDNAMLAHAVGRKRVHYLLLAKALEWLRPSSVLEVGFGNGLNLLLLSMQFPDVAFSGVELTSAGLAAATALAADPATAGILESFAVGPLWDTRAGERLQLCTGSADAIPLPDKSVDLAITVLALEQMERIREAALRELARVARRHVVMIEPFADWNTEPHRRGYIARNDYFAATVADLRRAGLAPVIASANMPNKMSFRAGIVIAEVGAA